jgi:hypothetical protein
MTHGFDNREPATGKPRALAGREPHVAIVRLLGEPDAALLARDFERARGFEAHELALRELEAEAFAA